MITVFAIIKHVSKNLNNSEHELQNLRFPTVYIEKWCYQSH